MNWIPVIKALPPEPIKPVNTLYRIIEAIEEGELDEYLVTIKGAIKSTTLYYIGDGEWFDAITKDLYPVVAWSKLPEVYEEGKCR